MGDVAPPVARVEQATGLSIDAASATLMAGGYWNQVWRAETDDGPMVIKRFADPAGTPMYPNLADHEAAALAHLAPHGLAPTVVAYLDDDPPLVVYRYVEGTIGYRSPAEAGELLARLHRVPPDSIAIRPLMTTAAQAAAHGDELAAMGPPDERLAALRPAEVSDHAPTHIVINHTDSGPGNVVATETTSLFIDWQAPGLGDAVEDLVCMTSPAMMILYDKAPHTPAEESALISAYADADVIARYERDRPAWTYRIAAYCHYRTTAATGWIADAYARAFEAEIGLLEKLR